MVQMKDIRGWFGARCRKSKDDSDMFVLLWWQGCPPHGCGKPAWGWALLLSPRCACRRCSVSAGVTCSPNSWMDLTSSRQCVSVKSHKWGPFLSVASSCKPSSDWCTLFPRVAHTPLRSAPSPGSHSLVSRHPEEWSGHLVGSAPQLHQCLSTLPVLMRMVKEIFGKVLQSHIITVTRGQADVGSVSSRWGWWLIGAPGSWWQLWCTC